MGQAWAAGPYACVGVSAGLKLKADRLAPQLCRGFPRSSAGDWSKRRAVVIGVGLSRAATSKIGIRLLPFLLFDTSFSFRHGVFRYPFSHSLAAAPRHCYATRIVQTRTYGSATYLGNSGTGLTRDMVVRLKTATSMSEASTRYPFSAPSCKRSSPACPRGRDFLPCEIRASTATL